MSSMLIHVMVAYLLQLVSLPQISWILFGIGNRHIPWPPWQHPRNFFGHTLNGSAQALLLGCKKEAISGGNTSSAHRISLWRWSVEIWSSWFSPCLAPSKSPIAWLLVYLPTRGFCWSLVLETLLRKRRKNGAWQHDTTVHGLLPPNPSMPQVMMKVFQRTWMRSYTCCLLLKNTYCETAWRTVMLESMEFQRKVIGKDPQKSKYVM